MEKSWFRKPAVIVLLALLFALITWLVDSLLDSFVLSDEDIWASLALDMDPEELYDDLVVVVSFVLFGLLIAWVIAKLNKAESEQISHRKRLAAANEELKIFAYTLAHDLRAPMRHINGFCEMLFAQDDNQIDDQSKCYLDQIRQSTRRMDALINDILRLSKACHDEIIVGQVNLSIIASTAAERQRRHGPGREVEISIADEMTASCDVGLMQIVIENLLSNAWKFTSRTDNAQIKIGILNEDGAKRFFIKDNGIGFDPSMSEEIFGLFKRLHSRDEYPGTGIGLATTRRIIERHGGRIWAESEEGKGAIFYFTLA